MFNWAEGKRDNGSHWAIPKSSSDAQNETETEKNVISFGKYSPVKIETLREIEEIWLEFHFQKNTEKEGWHYQNGPTPLYSEWDIFT